MEETVEPTAGRNAPAVRRKGHTEIEANGRQEPRSILGR